MSHVVCTLVLSLLGAVAWGCSAGQVDTSLQREREIYGALELRPARYLVWPTLDYEQLAAEVRAGVEQVCGGEPAAARAGKEAVARVLREVDPVRKDVFDDGNVEAMRGLMIIDEAGWKAASGPAVDCGGELARWKGRAEGLAAEILRASLEANMLLVPEAVDVRELERLARHARPAPRARLLARAAAIRRAVEWTQALGRHLKALSPEERQRRCEPFAADLPPLPDAVNNAVVEVIRYCEGE